jgi:hypothetical protein
VAFTFLRVWYVAENGDDNWMFSGKIFDYHLYSELEDLYYFWGEEIFNFIYLCDLDESGAEYRLQLFEKGMAGRPNLEGFGVCDGGLLFKGRICLDVYDESPGGGGLIHFRPGHKIEELSGDYSFFYTGMVANMTSLKNCILAHRFLGTRKTMARFSRDDDG